MKHTSRLIIFAVDVLVAALIVGVIAAVYTVIADIGYQQIENLNSTQESYKDADLQLYDKQVLPAAQAVSLAKKYRSSNCKVMKANASSGVVTELAVGAITLNSFAEGSYWRVDVEKRSNGTIGCITFTAVESSADDPSTLDEAKQQVTNELQMSTDSSWTMIKAELQELMNGKSFKQQVAAMCNVADTAPFSEVLSALEQKLRLVDSSAVSSSQEVTLTMTQPTTTFDLQKPKMFIVSTPSLGCLIEVQPDGSLRYSGELNENNFKITLPASGTNQGSIDASVYLHGDGSADSGVNETMSVLIIEKN